MDRTRSSVSSVLALSLLNAEGPALPLDAQLRYNASDPYAVEALFDTGNGEPVRWVFSRDLLAQGLRERAGIGDVTVWPVTDSWGQPAVRLRLSSPGGAALLEVPADSLSAFIDETYRLVASGTESRYIDLDAVVQALLS